MKDAVATMGNVLPDDVHGRDAVHVAVFSAVSRRELVPGDDVSIKEKIERDYIVDYGGDTIGVVDPFIGRNVMPGERFWVYLYPRTITALSHKWSHPAFEDTNDLYGTPADKLRSEKWIRNWVDSNDCPSYEDVMAKARDIAEGRGSSWDDEYMHFDGRDAHGEIPDEFWHHAEIILGKKIEGNRPQYFSCSC